MLNTNFLTQSELFVGSSIHEPVNDKLGNKNEKYKVFLFREEEKKSENYVDFYLFIPVNTVAVIKGVWFKAVPNMFVVNGKTNQKLIEKIEDTPYWFKELLNEAVKRFEADKTSWKLKI